VLGSWIGSVESSEEGAEVAFSGAGFTAQRSYRVVLDMIEKAPLQERILSACRPWVIGRVWQHPFDVLQGLPSSREVAGLLLHCQEMRQRSTQ